MCALTGPDPFTKYSSLYGFTRPYTLDAQYTITVHLRPPARGRREAQSVFHISGALLRTWYHFTVYYRSRPCTESGNLYRYFPNRCILLSALHLAAAARCATGPTSQRRNDLQIGSLLILHTLKTYSRLDPSLLMHCHSKAWLIG